MYQDLVRHLVLSFLEVVAGSDYKITVFSLPAEIRKKIMKLVLGRHEVLLTMPNDIEREYRPFLVQAAGKVHSWSRGRKKKSVKDDFRDSTPMEEDKEDKVRRIKDRRL